jgi:endonuclease V-like protein UPF0215 family
VHVPRRPHTLGIDDGPFEKGQLRPVPVVAVWMEGCDLVEGVASRTFPVDGDGATDFLAAWIRELRAHPALHGIFLGGITIAGLGVIDVERLAAATERPVLVVNRRDPQGHALDRALAAAGLSARGQLVARTPRAFAAGDLYLACAGIDAAGAGALLRSARRKGDLPEPLRLAHLIASAIERGESHGRA